MLTIEIIAILLLLVGLLIFSMVRTLMQRREAELLGRVERAARILLVDDDPDFVKITKRILDSRGYDVETASSGAQALKTMRSGSPKPDLVLLDIMMDYITDGLDVSNAIQRDPLLKDIPVIMVTSLTGVKSQEIFPSDQRVAVRGWLSKPVRAETLLKAVQDSLAGAPEGVPVSAAAVS
ncbi:MAG: response regulator [Anaerolineae bacterium]|nr:response regulator [Anaerolineae bacterium]